MPRYYFHITHEKPSFDEADGIDLPDLAAAWEQATRACGEMMQEIDGQLAMGTDWRMEVYDSDGPVFQITFGAKSLR